MRLVVRLSYFFIRILEEIEIGSTFVSVAAEIILLFSGVYCGLLAPPVSSVQPRFGDVCVCSKCQRSLGALNKVRTSLTCYILLLIAIPHKKQDLLLVAFNKELPVAPVIEPLPF